MEVNCSQLVQVQDPTNVAEARRIAARTATPAGLSRDRASDLAIVVTELATNLIKHGRGGVVIFRAEPGTVEILTLDKGPGMDPAKCLRDGYSTSGTLGHGLGAVGRLARQLEIYSTPESGTVVYAQVGDRLPPDSPESVAARTRAQIGAISTAMKGESSCGDVWMTREADGRLSIFVADGLGHGQLAAEASADAADAFSQHWTEAPASVVSAIHGRLRATRGAAIALCQIDFLTRTVTYCGIGNVCAAIVDGDAVKRMVSHNGTAGMGTPRASAFSYPWPPSAVIIMHTDGILTRWDLAKYSGLSSKHPALIAGVLYRDFERGRDDATLVIARKEAR